LGHVTARNAGLDPGAVTIDPKSVRNSFFTTILLAASTAFAATNANSPRLNVLYIISDDLNNDLGCYGNPVVKSPSLDRLAAHGVRFDHAYCNYPVCNCSRTSFLSGRRPGTTHIVDNVTPTRTFLKDAIFMPEYFRQQGYRTIKVGKIYHTGADFEDPRSWDTDIREKREAKQPPEKQILRRQGPSGIVLRAEDKDTWDGFVARKAVELLEQCVKDGKPFFVAVGFRRPHTPYIAPEKYFALYDPDQLKPRYGPPEHLANIPNLALTYRLGERKFPETRPGDTIAAYYASVSFMDAQVGVLLDALDRLKLWDRTVVVFHSDHGYHLGEHGGLWHKMCLFEETTRVPLIVAAPAKKPGASPGLVELVDLYPTLVSLCELKIPAGLEGTSFVPLLDKPERTWKRAVFTVVSRGRNIKATLKLDENRMGRTVFDGRWRYTQWPDATAELYDHKQDPFEYANLAKDTAHHTELEAMKGLLHNGWKAATPQE